MQQERLVHVFQRVARLAERRSQRLHTDWAAAVVIDDHAQVTSIHFVETAGVHIQTLQGVLGARAINPAVAEHLCKVARASQQAVGDTRCAPSAACDLQGRDVVHFDLQQRSAAPHHLGKLFRGVVVHALHDAEARQHRAREQTCARGCAHQRKRLQRKLKRHRVGAIALHHVDAKVFHGRVQVLFDNRRQTMDLVNEQHVTTL